MAYGGATYATVPAAALGLSVTPEHLGDLIALGREIKWALNDTEHAVHPTDPRLNGIYGTIRFDELGDADGQVHQRNVTVFADGEVDRSPCGSGTSARLAVLAADGRMPAGTDAAARLDRRETFIGACWTPSTSRDGPRSSRRSPARRTAPASTLLDRSARSARPGLRASMS